MKTRPILFSAPMVRALLDGSKTQTRREIKPQPDDESADGACWLDIDARHQWAWNCGEDQDILPNERQFFCPYGQPGDRLWVRETHYLHGIWSVHKDESGKRRWTFHPNKDMGVDFTEPNGFTKGRITTVPGWYRRPSIHMPRWASRITLEITEVRVERLQDISEDDALAEGCSSTAIVHDDGEDYTGHYAKEEYQDLWESLNGPGSWDANPWVWVVEFKRVWGGEV